MDKYEYKLRVQEIKNLIKERNFTQAAAIADTIDWTKCKSIMMLCTISDVYKINRRLEDARDTLLLAYEKYPGGRSIVYALCELAIKMDDVVQAVEYYKEFVKIAPKDSGRYILQYKLYEAQEVSLEERIEVLEELKGRDYTEKWAYELAYLYHRIGLETKCVEECDELILMFGEGRYVMKAMELKRLHEPLTEAQQDKYNQMKNPAAYAEEEEPAKTDENAAEANEGETAEVSEEAAMPAVSDAPAGAGEGNAPSDDMDIQVKVMNVGQYDTINIQRELAENMKELWEERDDHPLEADAMGSTKRIILPNNIGGETKVLENLGDLTGTFEMSVQEIVEAAEPAPAVPEKEPEKEVFFGETEDLGITTLLTPVGSVSSAPNKVVMPAQEEIPSQYNKILGMEYDGQISMVVPAAEEKVEKQITGQISIDEALVEWERMKKENEQKRMAAVSQHILQQTGSMFTEFEEATRDSLLEKLERGKTFGLEGLSDSTAEADELPEEEYEEITDADSVEELEEIEEPVAEDAEEISEEEPCEEFAEEELTEEELTEEAEVAVSEESAEEVTEEIPEETEEGAEDTEEISEEETYEETAEEATDDEAEAEEEKADADISEDDDEEEEDFFIEEDEEDVEEEESSFEKRKKIPANYHKVRRMTQEELELFGTYAQNKSTRDQIVYALENISMAAYTGNIILTGEEGMDTLSLAKKLMKEIQENDSNFSGKTAKISASALNNKGAKSVLDRITNGALIIQNAGELSDISIAEMQKVMNQDSAGMILILEDSKKNIHALLKKNPVLREMFNIRIHVAAQDDESLVDFAKQYALKKEYSIDDMGILALHTKISSRQANNHIVTRDEVQEIMDEAIEKANKKSLGHFVDILVAKRYDKEDMIILREKDFR